MSAAWYIVLERDIPGLDHFVNGKALAKAPEQLDSFAKARGLPTLMSFFSMSSEELAGFAEDHGVSVKETAPQRWFSAEDGLQAVNGLLDEAVTRKLDAHVIAELKEFQSVLEVARQNKVRWHLAVDF